jgi:hypothetical protein
MCLSSPSMPAIPAAIQNPTEQDAAVQSSLDSEKRRRAAASGLASTLLNTGGAAGIPGPATAPTGKTLLGM